MTNDVRMFSDGIPENINRIPKPQKEISKFNNSVTLNIGQVKTGHKYHVSNGGWDMHVTDVSGDTVTCDTYGSNGCLISRNGTISISEMIDGFELHPYNTDEKQHIPEEKVYFEAYREMPHTGGINVLHGSTDLTKLTEYIKAEYYGKINFRKITTKTEKLFDINFEVEEDLSK